MYGGDSGRRESDLLPQKAQYGNSGWQRFLPCYPVLQGLPGDGDELVERGERHPAGGYGELARHGLFLAACAVLPSVIATSAVVEQCHAALANAAKTGFFIVTGSRHSGNRSRRATPVCAAR